MTTHRRKKNVKQRGSKTHGWGSMKKHRGAGNRGGRGKAGTGKRGDQKKPTIINLYGNDYFGKKGFKRPTTKKLKAININTLERNLSRLLSENLITKGKDNYVIDLKKLGFDKLLGTGKATKKMNITVDKASGKAIAKVQEAGGKVETLAAEEAEFTEEE
jgi:large subunit ribosomal protein L15